MEPDQNNINVDANIGNGNSSSGSSAGPIIGIIILIAVVILGGLYFWGQRVNNQIAPTETNIDPTTEAIKAQSTADDTSSIEADLNFTDVDNLDAELNAL